MTLENLIQSKKWIIFKPLTKGWSKDVKYYAEDVKKQKFLLRISENTLYDKRLEQFNLLKEVYKLGLNTPNPYEFGKLDDGRVYMILSFLEGQDAKRIIPTLDERKQYELGIEAGKILKKLHDIPIISNKSWKDIYENKIPKKIKAAKKAKIKHKHLDVFINYVLDNKQIIEKNPIKFQHGDYHIGNMIITNDLKIGIIDFDKMDIADPLDDFKPFVWTVNSSSIFQTGLIDGYYDNNVPETFFRTLALYAAESCIGHVSWAISFGDEEVRVALEVGDKVYEWYQGFSIVVPTWYDTILKDKYKNNLF